jgi:hypothetical protein
LKNERSEEVNLRHLQFQGLLHQQDGRSAVVHQLQQIPEGQAGTEQVTIGGIIGRNTITQVIPTHPDGVTFNLTKQKRVTEKSATLLLIHSRGYTLKYIFRRQTCQ